MTQLQHNTKRAIDVENRTIRVKNGNILSVDDLMTINEVRICQYILEMEIKDDLQDVQKHLIDQDLLSFELGDNHPQLTEYGIQSNGIIATNSIGDGYRDFFFPIQYYSELLDNYPEDGIQECIIKIRKRPSLFRISDLKKNGLITNPQLNNQKLKSDHDIEQKDFNMKSKRNIRKGICKTESGMIKYLSEMISPKEFCKCIVATRKRFKINTSMKTIIQKMYEKGLIAEDDIYDIRLTDLGKVEYGSFYSSLIENKIDIHFPIRMYFKYNLVPIREFNLKHPDFKITQELIENILVKIRENPKDYKLKPQGFTRFYDKNASKVSFRKNIELNECRCSNRKIRNLDDMISVKEFQQYIKDRLGIKISYYKLMLKIQENGYIKFKYTNQKNIVNIKFPMKGYKNDGAKYSDRENVESAVYFPINVFIRKAYPLPGGITVKMVKKWMEENLPKHKGYRKTEDNKY